MNKIKVSEIFATLQGESRYTGVPSVFLRTFGCNFKCAGFGMPKGILSTEADEVDPSKYNKYEELPLVSSGCDSFPSWHPKFKHFSPMLTIDDIANRMVSLLPNKEWGDFHLVITGGEPLLGWQRAYPNLLSHPLLKDLKELTFETNGTQEVSSELKAYLNEWQNNKEIAREITFSVSPKLSISGEQKEEAIRPKIVCEYATIGYTYLKFVVATEEDVKETLDTIKDYRNAGFKGPVYLMPVGGTADVFFMNNKTVAELALKYGLRYSDRLQVGLWKNAWNT